MEGEIGLVLDDPNLYKVGDGTKKWTELPYRGFNGTVAQELGTSQDAVMSQKAVTDAIRDANNLTYIDGKSMFGSALIKELYIYKIDGTPVTQDIYIRNIYNNVPQGTNADIRYVVVFSDADNNALIEFLVSYPTESPGTGVQTMIQLNQSGLYGYGVFDWDSFNNKFPAPFYYNKNKYPLEKLSRKAFTLDENPMIRKYIEDKNAEGDEFNWYYVDGLCQPNTSIITPVDGLKRYRFMLSGARKVLIKARLSPGIEGDNISFYNAESHRLKYENVEVENIFAYDMEVPPEAKWLDVRIKDGDEYFVNVFLEKKIKIKNYFKASINTANNTFWNNNPTLFVVPIYGQSLSVGAATGDAISTNTKYPGMWMTNLGVICNRKSENEFQGFKPMVERATAETPASGLAEKAIETLQQLYGISPYDTDFWGTHKIVVACVGRGSTGIDDLKEGTDDFNGFVSFMSAMSSLAEEIHWKFRTPGFVWMQGERDCSMYGQTAEDGVSKYGENYSEKLIALTSALQNAVPDTAGISNTSFSIFSYQTSPSLLLPAEGRDNEEDRFPTEILNAQNHDVDKCFCPMYAVDHSHLSAEQSVHLSALGSKITGAYAGIQIIKRCWLLSRYTRFAGVSSVWTGDNNKIRIHFYGCTYPLRFETLHVVKAENYGFSVYQDAAEGGGKREKLEIEAVTIYNESHVEIRTKTTFDKSKHVKVYYGYNKINTSAVPHDGRFAGSRGNLCGSEDSLYKIEINGYVYDLPFYVYAFDFEIPAT